MNPGQLFVLAFLGGLSGALMPGPLLTVNIEESIRRGAWTGPKLIFGHAVLELALIVTILLGFGRLLDLGPVKGAIGILGGAVLVWMAYGMIAEAVGGLRLPGREGSPRRSLPLPMAGALVSLANPYWSIWWVTVGLTFLAQAREAGIPGVALFFAGHATADLLWYSAVSLAAAGGRRLMTDRVYQGIILACGIFLAGVGLWFVDSGLGFLELARPSVLIREGLKNLF